MAKFNEDNKVVKLDLVLFEGDLLSIGCSTVLNLPHNAVENSTLCTTLEYFLEFRCRCFAALTAHFESFEHGQRKRFTRRSRGFRETVSGTPCFIHFRSIHIPNNNL